MQTQVSRVPKLQSGSRRSFSGRTACGLLALALAAAGCSHKQAAREAPAATLFTPRPPTFLSGPMAVLFTNTAGFSARLVVENEAFRNPARPLTGQLLGRSPWLLFAPDPGEVPDKHAPAGGYSYLWNPAEQRGFVLSEALQGYAPVAQKLQATNVTIRLTQAAAQKIGGHACATEEATVQLSDGSQTVFQVWQATDLKGFPVRISATSNAAPLAVSLSKIRLEPPTADLFAPPEGFTRYDSPEMMADELVMRQHNLKRKGREELEPLDRPARE